MHGERSTSTGCALRDHRCPAVYQLDYLRAALYTLFLLALCWRILRSPSRPFRGAGGSTSPPAPTVSSGARAAVQHFPPLYKQTTCPTMAAVAPSQPPPARTRARYINTVHVSTDEGMTWRPTVPLEQGILLIRVEGSVPASGAGATAEVTAGPTAGANAAPFSKAATGAWWKQGGGGENWWWEDDENQKDPFGGISKDHAVYTWTIRPDEQPSAQDCSRELAEAQKSYMRKYASAAADVPPAVVLACSRETQAAVAALWQYVWRGPTLLFDMWAGVQGTPQVPPLVYPMFVLPLASWPAPAVSSYVITAGVKKLRTMKEIRELQAINATVPSPYKRTAEGKKHRSTPAQVRALQGLVCKGTTGLAIMVQNDTKAWESLRPVLKDLIYLAEFHARKKKAVLPEHYSVVPIRGKHSCTQAHAVQIGPGRQVIQKPAARESDNEEAVRPPSVVEVAVVSLPASLQRTLEVPADKNAKAVGAHEVVLVLDRGRSAHGEAMCQVEPVASLAAGQAVGGWMPTESLEILE